MPACEQRAVKVVLVVTWVQFSPSVEDQTSLVGSRLSLSPPMTHMLLFKTALVWPECFPNWAAVVAAVQVMPSLDLNVKPAN